MVLWLLSAAEPAGDSATEVHSCKPFKDVEEESGGHEATPAAAAVEAGGKPSVWHSFNARLLSLQLDNPKKPPSPPFLMYKWPKGLRGWSIIGLLLVVAVPSVLLLAVVGRGIAAGKPEMFLEGEVASLQA